ncbi:hypothetical protein MKX01_011433 [Papaver californicum]|nr:hypothetical protein MKX01_011433 [Papaver californicum]
MEKMNLARNICKTLYGFRYSTFPQRLTNSTEDLVSLLRIITKSLQIPTSLSSSSMEAKHFHEAAQRFDKSLRKLAHAFTHIEVFFLSLSTFITIFFTKLFDG